MLDARQCPLPLGAVLPYKSGESWFVQVRGRGTGEPLSCLTLARRYRVINVSVRKSTSFSDRRHIMTHLFTSMDLYLTRNLTLLAKSKASD